MATINEWLQATQVSGSGNATITLIASNNTEFESRLASLIISGGTKSKTLSVRQRALTRMITFNPDKLDFDENGGTKEVIINSNFDWSISNIGTGFWSVSQESGTSGTTYLFVTVEPSPINRTANIVFSDGSHSFFLPIYQEDVDIDLPTSDTILYYKTLSGDPIPILSGAGGQYYDSDLELWCMDVSQLTEIPSRAYQNNTDLRAVSIPSCIKRIMNASFYNCTYLKTLRLAEGVELLDGYCFEKTAIKRVEIPSTITNLYACLFAYTPLEEIKFDSPFPPQPGGGSVVIPFDPFQDVTDYGVVRIPAGSYYAYAPLLQYLVVEKKWRVENYDVDYMEIDRTSIEVDGKRQEETINVKSTTSWVATCPDWITLSVSEGEAEMENGINVVLSIQPNTGSVREDYVIFSHDGAILGEVYVKQTVVAPLIINRTTLSSARNVDFYTQDFNDYTTFIIYVNGEESGNFNYSTDGDWITLSKTGNYLRADYEVQRPDTTQKKANITIWTDDDSITFEVTQPHYKEASISSKSFDMHFEKDHQIYYGQYIYVKIPTKFYNFKDLNVQKYSGTAFWKDVRLFDEGWYAGFEQAPPSASYSNQRLYYSGHDFDGEFKGGYITFTLYRY